jgi:hypothetical protein
VRMLKLCGELNLTSEAVRIQSRRKVRRQHLHDDLSLELDLLGHEHPRHSTAAELSRYAVGCSEYFLKLLEQFGGHLKRRLHVHEYRCR